MDRSPPRDRERDLRALLRSRSSAASIERTTDATALRVDATRPRQEEPAAQPPSVNVSRGEHGALVDDIIRGDRVSIGFLPIVDIICRQIVGFEALARGPEGPLRSPLALFAAARAAGRAGELDWVCRATAFRLFLKADLHPTISLLINVERDSLVTPCPERLLPSVHEAERRLRVFIDIEGRSVARYPREVFQTVRHARAAHWGVSMNDLEVSSSALALLPVLAPDVIRLNPEVQSIGLRRGRSALFAALAETEHTGAALLTDHIENADSESAAISAGTRYTQGYFYGAPANLPTELPTPKMPLRILQHPEESETPFAIAVASGATSTIAPINMRGVQKLIGDFLALVDDDPMPAFVGVLTPDDGEISATALIFARAMADKSALHLVMGRNTAVLDDWSTHAVDLPPDHPFLKQICFVALSPHLAVLAAFRATEVAGSHGSEASTWEVAISQNPTVCRRVVRRLLAEADVLEGGVLARGR